MSAFYEFVGRAVISAIMTRFGSQIRAAGALTVAAGILGLGIYIATREDAELDS